MHELTSYDLNKSTSQHLKHLWLTHAVLNVNNYMATTHQSWHIATSRIHHVSITYITHIVHIIHIWIHKSFSTTSNYREASSQIIIYIIVIFHYYPRVNSQSPTRNRSQNTKLWQSKTALLAVASWSARLSSSTRGYSPWASWGRTESEQNWVLSAFFTFFIQKRQL